MKTATVNDWVIHTGTILKHAADNEYQSTPRLPHGLSEEISRPPKSFLMLLLLLNLAETPVYLGGGGASPARGGRKWSTTAATIVVLPLSPYSIGNGTDILKLQETQDGVSFMAFTFVFLLISPETPVDLGGGHDGSRRMA